MCTEVAQELRGRSENPQRLHPNTILFIGACYGDRNSALVPFNSDMEYARQQRFIVTEFGRQELWDSSILLACNFRYRGRFPTASCICADVCCRMYTQSITFACCLSDLTSSYSLHESDGKGSRFGITRYKSGRADNGEDGEEELPHKIFGMLPGSTAATSIPAAKIELRQRQNRVNNAIKMLPGQSEVPVITTFSCLNNCCNYSHGNF